MLQDFNILNEWFAFDQDRPVMLDLNKEVYIGQQRVEIKPQTSYICLKLLKSHAN